MQLHQYTLRSASTTAINAFLLKCAGSCQRRRRQRQRSGGAPRDTASLPQTLLLFVRALRNMQKIIIIKCYSSDTAAQTSARKGESAVPFDIGRPLRLRRIPLVARSTARICSCSCNTNPTELNRNLSLSFCGSHSSIRKQKQACSIRSSSCCVWIQSADRSLTSTSTSLPPRTPKFRPSTTHASPAFLPCTCSFA